MMKKIVGFLLCVILTPVFVGVVIIGFGAFVSIFIFRWVIDGENFIEYAFIACLAEIGWLMGLGYLMMQYLGVDGVCL